MVVGTSTSFSENCFIVKYTFTEAGDFISPGPFVTPHLVSITEGSWDVTTEDGETYRFESPIIYPAPAHLSSSYVCVTPGEAFAVFNLNNPNMVAELVQLGILSGE